MNTIENINKNCHQVLSLLNMHRQIVGRKMPKLLAESIFMIWRYAKEIYLDEKDGHVLLQRDHLGYAGKKIDLDKHEPYLQAIEEYRKIVCTFIREEYVMRIHAYGVTFITKTNDQREYIELACPMVSELRNLELYVETKDINEI